MLKGSTSEPLAMLWGFTPGARISVIVQAVNWTTQSVPGAPVDVEIPGGIAADAGTFAVQPADAAPSQVERVAFQNGSGIHPRDECLGRNGRENFR